MDNENDAEKYIDDDWEDGERFVENHETEYVPIKWANIDLGIISVVSWINKFPHVYSLYSCEGNNIENETSRPYIMFLCSEFWDLNQIVKVLSQYASFEMNWYNELRFVVRFSSKNSLERFIKEKLE